MHYFPLDAFQHALSPPCALHSALQSTLNPTGALRVQRFDVFNNVSYRGFLLLLLFLFYFLNSRLWRLTCWKHKNHSAFFLKREQGSVHFCSQSWPSAAFKSCGIKEIYDLRAFKTFVELQNDGREEFMLVSSVIESYLLTWTLFISRKLKNSISHMTWTQRYI